MAHIALIEKAYGDLLRLDNDVRKNVRNSNRRVNRTKIAKYLHVVYTLHNNDLSRSNWSRLFRHIASLLSWVADNMIDPKSGEVKMPKFLKWFKYGKYLLTWICELVQIMKNPSTNGSEIS